VREFLILIIIVVLTSITYYFIEPFAHSEMHKSFPSKHFKYADLPAMQYKGDPVKGKALVMGAGACTGCHSIEVAGIKPSMTPLASAQAYGVEAPDLSDAGAVYDAKFLAAYIADPAKAMLVADKYGPNHPFPMPKFYGAGGNIHQEIADMVAYLQSIAVPKEKLTPKLAFETACGRCHAVHYENWTQIGQTPKFKHRVDKLEFDSKVLQYQTLLKKHLGSLPPDLSMYIRSRGEHFISTFVEDPQNYLKGTAMPRTGVNAHAAHQVVAYLENAGDPKKAERESLGKYVMIYFIIFVLAAYLWKREVWKELH
jgi:ubiquinol-cytochrome c reductase cytochrome c1 subunit